MFIEISNDGITPREGVTPGDGIKGMQQRAESFGGVLRVSTNPRFKISITI